MQVTRRYWAAVALVTLLAVAAVVFAQPILVVGAAGLGAWLLVQQVLFVRTVVHGHTAMAVTQSVTRERLVTDDTTQLVVKARLPDGGTAPSRVNFDIKAGLPVASSTTSAIDVHLSLCDENSATTTATLEWPTAGQFQFSPPTVTATDTQGLFQSSFALIDAPMPTVTVMSHRPRNVHVGQAGEQVATAFGDQKTGEFGLGLEPGDVRKYIPGDTLRRIDWKATARSQTPHVREFDEDTDRQTGLLVDQRASMGTGSAGETKLDYARQVVLAFVAHARAEREAIGLYTVGDDGLTARHPPDTGGDTYTHLRTAVQDLTPTDSETATGGTNPSLTPPTEARRKAALLQGEDSAFARQFHPLFAASETYVQRIETDPLYHTARTHLDTLPGTVSTIVVTDDTARAEIRETVKLLRHNRGSVLVFLTPTVLFEQNGLTDVSTAYDRYIGFEEFRRDLSRLDDVTAYELAPGERLDALLAGQSTQRTPHQEAP